MSILSVSERVRLSYTGGWQGNSLDAAIIGIVGRERVCVVTTCTRLAALLLLPVVREKTPVIKVQANGWWWWWLSNDVGDVW